jgi:Phage protein (N4 Gp49/phage Sf6 gene 66) family
MSIEETEAASAAVAKNPDGRVKLADIEAAIDYEFTSSAGAITRDSRFPLAKPVEDHQKSIALLERLRLTTLHVIVMRNGFTVIGKSTPLDPANFNAELGKRYAREDAIRQLWPLMAFSRADQAVS